MVVLIVNECSFCGGAIISDGDMQILPAGKTKSELYALAGDGYARTLDVSPCGQELALTLVPGLEPFSNTPAHPSKVARTKITLGTRSYNNPCTHPLQARGQKKFRQ